MTVSDHLRAIHDARTPRAVAGALGRASRQLATRDDLGLAVVRSEARSRMMRLAVDSIRTARDLRRNHAAR